MSEFEKDLIKILVDKGLLGILILLLGFVLNRAIERYKARNVYYQKLSEATIQAYQEVARALAAELMLLKRARIDLLEKCKTMPPQEAKEIIRTYYKDFFVAYREREPDLAKHSIFFSRELGKAINEHRIKVQDYWKAIWPKKEDTSLTLKQSEDMVDELSSNLTSIIKMLQEEIKLPLPSNKPVSQNKKAR